MGDVVQDQQGNVYELADGVSISEPNDELEDILQRFADWVEVKLDSPKVADNFDIRQAKAQIQTYLLKQVMSLVEGERHDMSLAAYERLKASAERIWS